MRRILATAVLGLLTVEAGATSASIRQATQLLERNYYWSASAMLRAGVSGADAASTAFLLGRAQLGNARLHQVLARSALETGARYLKRLAAQPGRERSRFASFYYGDVLAEQGKKSAARAALKKFLAQSGLGKSHRQMAEIRLAELGGTALPSASTLDAEARTELAAALSRRAGQRAEANRVLDRALADLRRDRQPLPMRALTNAIGVLARSDRLPSALDLAEREDLGRPSYQENLGKSKVLRFYDAALLGNLAELYGAAGVQQLERIHADARVGAVARFFLADFWLFEKRGDKAGAALAPLAGGSGLPGPLRDRVGIMQAQIDLLANKGRTRPASMEALAEKYRQDPVLLGHVLDACLEARGRCDRVSAAAQTLAAQGQGERFRGLHRALGFGLAGAGRAEPALQSLETARDKSNKNRIDTNDPLMLVQLADLYLATKSFSENLEIYFELSKEFPAVRQLQETGQGIYSMEYRSAGDVKIF